MDKPASDQSVVRAWVVPILANIVLPTVTYFVLVNLGMAEVPALLLSGVWPLVELLWTIRRQRHVDEFSVFVLIGIVAGVATSVFSDNARAVFLKDSITTGVIGLVFLLTLVVGKPLTFYFGQRFATDGSKVQRDWWHGLWAYPSFRRVQYGLTAAWGMALLGEALIRAVLTWRLGAGPMVAVNNVVPYVVIAVMTFVSVATGRRAQANAAKRGFTGPPAATPVTDAPVTGPQPADAG